VARPTHAVRISVASNFQSIIHDVISNALLSRYAQFSNRRSLCTNSHVCGFRCSSSHIATTIATITKKKTASVIRVESIESVRRRPKTSFSALCRLFANVSLCVVSAPKKFHSLNFHFIFHFITIHHRPRVLSLFVICRLVISFCYKRNVDDGVV